MSGPPSQVRDDGDLLAEIERVMRAIEEGPGRGITARLEALDAKSRAMNVDLCEFSRVHAPHFLPYYYLLEGSQACDDPS
ncbi:MAG TPA: hypothetical protein VHN99_09845, partial [Deinococcales bacterium]|nr:hypothetical protein [Deinococcales bacterium]